MGINAQQIVITKSDFNSVQNELAEYMRLKDFVLKESDPIKQITAPYEFEKRKRRFFFALEYPSVICLSELGELADRDLAQHLSLRLRASVYWMALHESENAWGKILFTDGEKENEELNPASAFEEGKNHQDYEGDATEEAFEACKAIGNFEPFITYHHLANGYRPEGTSGRLHLAFIKPWSS